MDENQMIAAMEARIAQLETMVTDLAARNGGDSDDGGEYGGPPSRLIPFVPCIGGDGDGGSGGAFAYKNGKLVDCVCMVAREILYLPDFPVLGTGSIYLYVDHANRSVRLYDSAVSGSEIPSSSVEGTLVPLYVLRNGEVVHDYRGMPSIQMWEL